MSRQEFKTVDVLRLEVRNDPPPGSVENDVVNDGLNDDLLGGYGWLSPIENTRVRSSGSDGLLLETITAQSGVYFTTEAIPVRAGKDRVSISVQRRHGTATVGVAGRVDFYDASDVFISSTSSFAVVTADMTFGQVLNVAQAAGAVSLKLRLTLTRAGGSALNALDSVSVSNVQLYQHTAAEYTAGLTVETGWTDILGPSHEINVERVELDVGVLTASIRDASLDPSQADTIRTGKQIRLMVDITGGGTDYTEPLFVGTIRNAQVSYDLTHPDANKRAQISLTAVDQAQPLANTTRPDGVAAVEELPAVFEGCGVPWNVNGDNGHTATTPVVVSRNENASAMDQVAITRDSNHAYAWFSRAGVVNVWDPATLAAFGPPVWGTPLDENAYNPGISMDYDTDRCINHVTLKYLRIDPVTGETEEVTYGPYTDDASRARWGTHAAEFTVHGITEDAATLAAYAAEILVANATPAVRINEVTVPINTTADIAEWAVRDLYDLLNVVNVNAGINEESRITRLSHRITGGGWTVTFGFTTEGGVAQPQVTPSPTPSGGKTLSELLRPVGEVTMWYGTTAQIPAGWLRCDGTAIPADYPDLIALIGANTPNMVDVFPIGAGTKALGTTGGDPTKTITAANLPSHSHNFSRATAIGSTGTFPRGAATDGTTTTTGATGVAATPMDVMPPWRALHFIIRAR